MAGEGFKDTLTKKLGPLPVWAWTGMGVVVLAILMIQRNKKAAAAAAAAAEEEGSSGGGVPATNLGSNSLSNLVPQAYPMPFQLGDIFVNGNPTVPDDDPDKPDPEPSKPDPVKPKPTPKPAAQPVSYVIAKGDTFDSIGKKLNIAPTTLWALTGMAPGKKVPAPGTQINIRGIAGNPDYAYANEAKIVAALNALAKTKPKAPAQGTVLRG